MNLQITRERSNFVPFSTRHGMPVTYNQYIGEYSTSGATNNAHLISGLMVPAGLAISGTNLFVAQLGANTISEYTTSGATVNSNLITVSGPNGIAISGNLLFV